MSETAVRQLLTDLVADEPFYAPDVDAAVAGGVRTRRRRRTLAVSLVPLGAVVVVGALAWAASAPRTGAGTATGRPGGLTVLPGAASLPMTGAGGVVGPAATIKAAVVAASPAGLDFSGLDRADQLGGYRLDGNVNDGHGAARLFVTVVPATEGGLIARPCSDVEFRGNGQCDTTTLADGGTLSSVKLTGGAGFRTENVVIVHPDGSGVLVEADNASIPWPRTVLTSQSKAKGLMTITRPQPIYSLTQLVAVANAVDAATATLR